MNPPSKNLHKVSLYKRVSQSLGAEFPLLGPSLASVRFVCPVLAQASLCQGRRVFTPFTCISTEATVGFGVVVAELAKSGPGDRLAFERSGSAAPSTLFCRRLRAEELSGSSPRSEEF